MTMQPTESSDNRDQPVVVQLVGVSHGGSSDDPTPRDEES